jgi:hypothetical protein
MHVELRRLSVESQWTSVRKANQAVYEGLVNVLALCMFGTSDLGSPHFGDKNGFAYAHISEFIPFARGQYCYYAYYGYCLPHLGLDSKD